MAAPPEGVDTFRSGPDRIPTGTEVVLVKHEPILLAALGGNSHPIGIACLAPRPVRAPVRVDLPLAPRAAKTFVRDVRRAGRLRHHGEADHLDRKSTRLNSSHLGISYAVFCLK